MRDLFEWSVFRKVAFVILLLIFVIIMVNEPWIDHDEVVEHAEPIESSEKQDEAATTQKDEKSRSYDGDNEKNAEALSAPSSTSGPSASVPEPPSYASATSFPVAEVPKRISAPTPEQKAKPRKIALGPADDTKPIYTSNVPVQPSLSSSEEPAERQTPTLRKRALTAIKSTLALKATNYQDQTLRAYSSSISQAPLLTPDDSTSISEAARNTSVDSGVSNRQDSVFSIPRKPVSKGLPSDILPPSSTNFAEVQKRFAPLERLIAESQRTAMNGHATQNGARHEDGGIEKNGSYLENAKEMKEDVKIRVKHIANRVKSRFEKRDSRESSRSVSMASTQNGVEEPPEIAPDTNTAESSKKISLASMGTMGLKRSSSFLHKCGEKMERVDWKKLGRKDGKGGKGDGWERVGVDGKQSKTTQE